VGICNGGSFYPRIGGVEDLADGLKAKRRSLRSVHAHSDSEKVGHQFLTEAARDSDLKPGARRSLPRIEATFFGRADW
jgi:hypothetical protein